MDDVPRGGDGTEHLLKIPEGAVKEVLGGCDREYDLPEGTPKELKMRIGWASFWKWRGGRGRGDELEF